jgi:hypothetical protein
MSGWEPNTVVQQCYNGQIHQQKHSAYMEQVLKANDYRNSEQIPQKRTAMNDLQKSTEPLAM